jgi:hypothetical protein
MCTSCGQTAADRSGHCGADLSLLLGQLLPALFFEPRLQLQLALSVNGRGRQNGTMQKTPITINACTEGAGLPIAIQRAHGARGRDMCTSEPAHLILLLGLRAPAIILQLLLLLLLLLLLSPLRARTSAGVRKRGASIDQA